VTLLARAASKSSAEIRCHFRLVAGWERRDMDAWEVGLAEIPSLAALPFFPFTAAIALG